MNEIEILAKYFGTTFVILLMSITFVYLLRLIVDLIRTIFKRDNNGY